MITVSKDTGVIRKDLESDACPFPLSSIRHTALAYFKSVYGTGFTNQSFIAYLDGEPVCCALRMEKDNRVSFLDQPFRVEFAPNLARAEHLEPLMREIGKEILSLLTPGSSMQLELPMRQEQTKSLVEILLPNATSLKGHIEAFVDLRPTGDTVESGLRKSHRQNAKKSSKLLGSPEIHHGTISPSVFTSFKKLHFLAAARKTRSEQSWEEMQIAILQEKAFLTTATLDGEMVGATFTWLSSSSALYGTGAYDRAKFKEIPISHSLVLTAIKYAQKIGRSTFIIGEAYAPEGTDKEKSIALFKRGFSPSRTYFHRMILKNPQ